MAIPKHYHGMSDTRLYSIWTGMKQRCYNPKDPAYKNYGGRGIIMCERWKNSFMEFYNDMLNGYSDSLTIERIDNNGIYCPENCRWATRQEQLINSRHIKHITIGKITRTRKEWCEIYKLQPTTYDLRRRKGMTSQQAITTPVRHKVYTINGITKPLTEWLKIYNINRDTHKQRVYHGWDEIEALITPVRKYK
jgi:hypothetical protein